MFAKTTFSRFIFTLATLFIVNGMTYRQTTLNACVDSCTEELVSLVDCASRCSLSQNCTGISVNRNNSTCCKCSDIGIPEQTADIGNNLFRKENDSICNRTLVEEVPDSHLTASSSYDATTVPSRARLHLEESATWAGAWCSKGMTDQYVQVRFLEIKEVYGVLTQGRNQHGYQWVTSFTISYSVDCATFSYVTEPDNTVKGFPGNYDQDTIVRNDLPESFLAVCVRIHPVTYSNHPSMRFDVIGCDL